MKKHSVTIAGHRTSITLEPEFWQALQDIAEMEKASIGKLIKRIDETRNPAQNLSSAVRVYILNHYKQSSG